MNQAGWIILGAALLVASTFLLPSPTGGGTLLRPSHYRPARWNILWGLLPPLLVGAVVAARIGNLTGISSALLSGVCVWSVMVMVASRKSVNRTEGMARLTEILANQATVSATPVEALSRAAPLVRGPVGLAAQQMAEECAHANFHAGADAFIRSVPTPPAEWLADIISITAAGGGQIQNMLSVLEARAGEHAATVRLFHNKVVALLPQLMAVVVLGAAVVFIVALTSDDLATWLVSQQGQLLTFLSSVMAVLLSVRVLLPAWKMAR